MKKLLLILICLFVSFEVKSESDDLSGTKLLCQNDKNFTFNSDNFINGYVGYEFKENFKLNHFSFSKWSQKGNKNYHFYDSYHWSYRTTLTKIEITPDIYSNEYKSAERRMKLLGEDDFGLRNYKYIFRESLKSTEVDLRELLKKYGSEENYSCKVFSGNLENHFKELKNNFEKQLKSKQKI